MAKIVIKIKKVEIHLPSEIKEEQKVDVEKTLVLYHPCDINF